MGGGDGDGDGDGGEPMGGGGEPISYHIISHHPLELQRSLDLHR